MARPGVARQVALPLTKLLTRDFASPSGMLAKNVIYELLDPLLLAALLAKEATLVHAGAVVSQDGLGLLLMGTGGVGKTTTVLDLVLNQGWRYLADDLVVLSDRGLSRYPKDLQVYAYNLALVPELGGPLMAGRGAIDRAVWNGRLKALGPANVRRRVSAERLLGPEPVGSGAPLAAAVKLTAAPRVAGVTVQSVPSDQLARQSASVILDEFWDFSRFTNALATLNSDAPSLADLHGEITGVLEGSLRRVPCVEVLVPPGTSGSAISEALQKTVLKDLAA